MASEKMGDSQDGMSDAEMKQGYRQVATVPLKEKPGFPGNDGPYDRRSMPHPNDSEGDDVVVKRKGE